MKAEVAEAEKIVRKFGKPKTAADAKKPKFALQETTSTPYAAADEAEQAAAASAAAAKEAKEFDELDTSTEDERRAMRDWAYPPDQAEASGAAEMDGSESKSKEETDAASAEGQERTKPPLSDIEYLRTQAHKDKAGSLRDNINSHLESNPNLSDEDRERANRVLSALESHHGVDGVPSKEQSKELKELASHAGDLGKKKYEEKESPKDRAASKLNAFNYLVGKMKEGAARGKAIGRAAASPGGAAAVAGQVLDYGVSGASSAGHKLLSGTTRGTGESESDESKETDETDETKTSESGKPGDTDINAADLSAARSEATDQEKWESWKEQYKQRSGDQPQFPTGFKTMTRTPADEERATSSGSEAPTPNSASDTKKSLQQAKRLHANTAQKAKELLVRYKHTGSYPY
jgi:hypothetical protein